MGNARTIASSILWRWLGLVTTIIVVAAMTAFCLFHAFPFVTGKAAQEVRFGPTTTASWTIFDSSRLGLSLKYPPQIRFKHRELNNGMLVFISFETDDGYMTVANSCEDRSTQPYDDPSDAIIANRHVKRYKLSPQNGYNLYGINLQLGVKRCVDILQGIKAGDNKAGDKQSTKELFGQILSTFQISST